MDILNLVNGCNHHNKPNSRQVIFINQDNIASFDDFFTREYENVVKMFKNCYFDFVYVPKVYTPEFLAEIIGYCHPELSSEEIEENANSFDVPSFYEHFRTEDEDREFNDLLLNKFNITYRKNHECLTSIFENVTGYETHHNGFVRAQCDNDLFRSLERSPSFVIDSHPTTYEFVELKEGSDDEMWAQIDDYLKHADYRSWESYHENVIITVSRSRIKIHVPADEAFPTEAFELAEDIKAKLEKLRMMGVNELAIKSLFFSKPKLSKMKITKDFKIILDDYQKREIKMGPLPKTVFLLFLRHPQGILFKNIHSYKKEVEALYLAISGKEMDKEMKMSIEHLTDPYYNSLNENCSRIRRAFLEEIDDEIAKYYYITGERATPKKIRLNQDMIIMESELPIPLTIEPIDLPF